MAIAVKLPLAVENVAQLPQGTFRFLVSGVMVDNGKPDPEPHLLGARLLGNYVDDVQLDRVVAVEHSIPGVTSALAAGAVTLGVPNVVEIPPTQALTIWPTLEGRTVADLDDLVCATLTAEVGV